MRVSAIISNYGLPKMNSKSSSKMQNSQNAVSFKVNPIKEIIEMGAAAAAAEAAREAAARRSEDSNENKQIPFPTGESELNPFPNDDWPDTAY